MNKIKVRFFGAFRNHFSTPEIVISMQPTQTVGEFKSELKNLYPALGQLLEESAVADSEQILGADRLIGDINELSLLPPVCGG